MVTSLIGALSASGVPDSVHSGASAIAGSLNLSPELSYFINTTQPASGNTVAPRAYLNVIFFDELFNFISPDGINNATASQRVEVANDGNAVFNPMQQKAPKNGYAFVYLSNESNEAVYFDDLLVSQEHSRIAEESHYYPHGLKIATLCSRAFNRLETKYGYQGGFSEEEEETGYNEFYLRNYDPQLGRWTSADPFDEFASPYIGIGKYPVNHVDSKEQQVWQRHNDDSKLTVAAFIYCRKLKL